MRRRIGSTLHYVLWRAAPQHSLSVGLGCDRKNSWPIKARNPASGLSFPQFPGLVGSLSCPPPLPVWFGPLPLPTMARIAILFVAFAIVMASSVEGLKRGDGTAYSGERLSLDQQFGWDGTISDSQPRGSGFIVTDRRDSRAAATQAAA